MSRIIETKKSFLDTYSFNENILIQKCLDEIDSKLIVNPKIKIFGRDAIQHRDVGFFSDKSKGYYYSGQFAKSIPLTESLKQLLKKINILFKSEFNGILINKYKDGKKYIGAHSDDEKNLDKVGVVALSYGESRKFRIRNKQTKKIVKDIETISGELIHMGGEFQKEFLHEIPIQSKITSERYSFTFRKHKY